VNYQQQIESQSIKGIFIIDALLDVERKICYYHRPKVASLSILKAFYASKNMLEKAYSDLNKKNRGWLHLYRSPTWYGHAKGVVPYFPTEQASLQHFEDPLYKNIFFVRNVYDRAISCFNQFKVWMDCGFVGPSLPNWENYTFNDYLDLLCDPVPLPHPSLRNVFLHAVPQVIPYPPHYKTEQEIIKNIDHLIFLEDILRSDFEFEKYNIPFNKKYFEKGSSPHHVLSGRKWEIYEQNKGSREKVEHIWKSDLEILKTTWEEFLKL